MTLEQLLPQLAPWVANLENVWPATFIKPQFAQWQVLHILSLVVLGGTTIILNLRLIGVGVTSESPSEIYRNLRTWLAVGVIGIVVTGILIGTANAERLYNSQAFSVKLLALVAGVIFTYGVSVPVAKADGLVSRRSKLLFALGAAVWGLGLWIFATADLINPGLWHLISAGALVVLFVAQGRLRWAYLAGLLTLIAAHFIWTHFVIKPDDYERLTPVNIASAWIFASWIAGTALVQLVRAGATPLGGPLTKLVGYATILVWVTAAAAGRWIAFA